MRPEKSCRDRGSEHRNLQRCVLELAEDSLGDSVLGEEMGDVGGGGVEAGVEGVGGF